MLSQQVRKNLIAEMATQPGAKPPVILNGLPDSMLVSAVLSKKAYKNGRITDSEYFLRSRFPIFPNETFGYSIYRIAFDDGSAYIGRTNQWILDRLSQHFGYNRRWGTPRIMRQVNAGIPYRFACLVSGLSDLEAKVREKIEIHKLEKPLNIKHTKTFSKAMFPGAH